MIRNRASLGILALVVGLGIGVVAAEPASKAHGPDSDARAPVADAAPRLVPTPRQVALTAAARERQKQMYRQQIIAVRRRASALKSTLAGLM